MGVLVFLDTFENTSCTLVRWVDEFFRVRSVEVEWRSSMSYRIDSFDRFVKDTILSSISSSGRNDQAGSPW